MYAKAPQMLRLMQVNGVTAFSYLPVVGNPLQAYTNSDCTGDFTYGTGDSCTDPKNGYPVFSLAFSEFDNEVNSVYACPSSCET